MSNEKKDPNQSAAQPSINLVGRHPDVIAKDPFYAAHEAAHGVTIDDKGWTVHEVNLDKRQTHADTAEFWKAVRETNWKNAAQREAMVPSVLAYVTTVVAGYLAEKQIGSPEHSVSQRVAQFPWFLEIPPDKLNSDTKRARYLLQLIQRNTEQMVAQLEAEAAEILHRRKAHHDALVAKLIELRIVKGKDLNDALGKEPLPEVPPLAAPEQAPP